MGTIIIANLILNEIYFNNFFLTANIMRQLYVCFFSYKKITKISLINYFIA